MKRDFLKFSDFTSDEILLVLERARELKRCRPAIPLFPGAVLGLVFEKESTRTRISFEVAMSRLGGRVIYINQHTSQLSRGETYADTARVLSRYLDAIVVRTFSQDTLEEIASHATVPVINGLTDEYHPCQILADLMTVKERFGEKDVLVSYVGDGNNMANTWIEAAALLGFRLNVATPKGFEVVMPMRTLAKKHSQIMISTDPVKAVSGAHVINTDTWFSMGQKVTAAKKKAFQGFQVNDKLLKQAAKDAVVLHCLPAHRGEEITDAVLDGPQSAVFDQAENRLHVQTALLEKLLKR